MALQRSRLIQVILDLEKTGTRRRGKTGVDYRSILASSGDLQIGSAVRRSRRRRLVIASGGLLLLATAIGLFIALRPLDQHAASRQYAVRVHCRACGHTTQRLVSSSEPFPLTCVMCGKREACQVWRCQACGKDFEPERHQQYIECPACRSKRVGSPVIPAPPP